MSKGAVQLSACSDGSFCPRNENDVNTTCCYNREGKTTGLDDARIALTELNDIRGISTATPLGSSAAETFSIQVNTFVAEAQAQSTGSALGCTWQGHCMGQ